jgi:hypothetical protein
VDVIVSSGKRDESGNEVIKRYFDGDKQVGYPSMKWEDIRAKK